MTKMWTYIDGTRVSVPVHMLDAEPMGWHKGTDFWHGLQRSDLFKLEMSRQSDIKSWCRRTFANNSYTELYDGIWFYREQDAVLCRLKWGLGDEY